MPKAILSYFWLLHHESRPCDDDEIISFYNIVDVDEAQSVDFIISNETILKMSVAGNQSLKEKISKFIKMSRSTALWKKCYLKQGIQIGLELTR